MTIQNTTQNTLTTNQAFEKKNAFFNTTNQKEKTMTDLSTLTNLNLPDISTLTNEEKTAYKIEVNTRLKRILNILTTGRKYINTKERQTYSKIAIYANSWLLHLDVATVEDIKTEVKATNKNLEEVYKEHFNRKEWENRKDLTDSIVNKITNDSLTKLDNGKWTTNDLPTISKALKEIKKNKPAKIEILTKGEYKQLPIPDQSKFLVIYASLADNIDIKTLSKHIADNAVGFFWLDDSNIQQSLKTINDLGFVIKELAYWNTGKSHNGAITTKQQHNMVVACKGKPFKPSTFRLDSAFFEYENKDSKPMYYAEIIRQMFPNLAVLEVHKNDIKYIATDYTLADIKTLKSK